METLLQGTSESPHAKSCRDEIGMGLTNPQGPNMDISRQQPTPTSSPAPKDRLLRIAEVLRRIGMRRSWTYREIAAGRFPRPHRLGGASCWLEADIDTWIASVVYRKADR